MFDDPLPDTACEREPIELLAAEFAQRQRSGDAPSVESYACRYPELAELIRELFPTILRLERLKRGREHSPRGLATAGLPRSARLGGFRIVREIGRGGMGIVYEAEDRVLKRRVALKVLGANIAGSGVPLQRFRREAQSAARLHHTNIVPVFGTGEEHGVMFYVMQFIDGMALSDVIERLREGDAPQVPAEEDKETTKRDRERGSTHDDPCGPSPCLPFSLFPCLVPAPGSALGRVTGNGSTLPPAPGPYGWRHWKTTVQIGIYLADALDYAHSQGVLHRDVKPANVLVDRTGLVWIADFGLAKHMEHPGVTATGDLIGSLRYMAPEQFHGQTDVRSDICSLGLTLYELLTLKPAFAETHQAHLVKQKTTGLPPRVRSIRPDLPRDLETILLKACALEPAQRYRSAAALAGDLRRLDQDQPILARRASAIERLWRWSRRNRAMAGLIGLAALLLVALAAIFAVGKQRTAAALNEAIDAAERADAERRRAEGNLEIAVRAMNEIVESVSGRGLPKSLSAGAAGGEFAPRPVAVTEADAALLRSLLGFFDEFAAQNGANLNAQSELAWQRIGEIQQRLGNLSDAEAAFQSSIGIQRTLIAAAPADPQRIVDLAELWNRIGTVRSQRGDVPAAFEAHDRARELLESSVARSGSNVSKFLLAETFTLLGTVGSRAGGAEMVPEMFGASRRGNGRSVRPPPPPIERDKALERARSILTELLEGDPHNAAWQFALAKAYRSQLRLGPPRRGSAASEEARHAADQAIRILRELVSRFPESPVYAYELANTLGRVAQRLPQLEPAERQGLLGEALRLASRLGSAHPQVSEYEALIGSTERRLGRLAHLRGDAAEAQERYRQALDLCGRLARRFPAVSCYQVGYAQTLSEWAQVQQAHHELESAREAMSEAVGIAERTAQTWKSDPLFRDFLAHLQRRQRELDAL
jgi:serine/threonine protein kinase